jgi:hypothetical protein
MRGKRLDFEEHESGSLERRSWGWTDGINKGGSGASRKWRSWCKNRSNWRDTENRSNGRNAEGRAGRKGLGHWNT